MCDIVWRGPAPDRGDPGAIAGLEAGLPSPGFGKELDLVPRPHVPSHNYLLAALQPLDRERIYPHLELIPMPLGRFCTNLGTWCITFTL